MKQDTFKKLLALLNRLREARVSFTLRHSREDALMIEALVPGQRWEIEFVDYGDEVQVEVERFVSDGSIGDAAALDDLFANFSDKQVEPIPNDEPARK